MAFRYAGFADEAGKTLAQQIQATQLAKWSAIELRAIDSKNVCDLTPGAWASTWAQLQEAGISVAGFGSQIANWSRTIETPLAKDEEELRRAIPYMQECGCKLIRIMSYPNVKENPWPKEKWRDEAIRRLQHLAEIAGDHGIILGHENCSGYAGGGPEEALELIAGVDHASFQLIFDTGNNSGHTEIQDIENTWRYYEAVKDHVIHVHIKAFKPGAEAGKLVTCFPDEDPVQARIINDLKNRGYDGWLSIEPHIAAIAHTGERADVDKSTVVYVEYTQRLEKLVKSI